MRSSSRLVCNGCGYEFPVEEPYPFHCPRAGSDDRDHVLRPIFDRKSFGSLAEVREMFLSQVDNPFLRYRSLLHSYQVGLAGGLTDSQYVDIVRRLDDAVAAIDGHGFRETPFAPSDGLAAGVGMPLGMLWVKDETGNVSGSHKGRHMQGLMIWLEVVERLGWRQRAAQGSRLAVASCGNAALAAAVVARAAGRKLDVFIPPDADPDILEHLGELGARMVVCPRQRGEEGDPCHRMFQQAVASGHLPFTCQGSDNGLVIEGGKTLAWEMVSSLLRAGGEQDHGTSLDQIVIQVGGGALASACVQGFEDVVRLGILPSRPRVQTVQTRGGWPLQRAWDHLAKRIVEEHGAADRNHRAPAPDERIQLARWIAAEVDDQIISDQLRYAAEHRSAFMWAWETEPRSLARGILDDETYDWHAVVEAMLRTGGAPLVASEESIESAWLLARQATGIPVGPTGASGLAGLVEMSDSESPETAGRVAVLFTGTRR